MLGSTDGGGGGGGGHHHNHHHHHSHQLLLIFKVYAPVISLHPAGTVHPHPLAAFFSPASPPYIPCHPMAGEKWSATKWIHVSKYGNDEVDDPSAPCANHNDGCEDWAESGECEKNPKYMLRYCKMSCGKCTP